MKLEKVLTYQKGRSPQKNSSLTDNLVLYLTPEYLRSNCEPNYVLDFSTKVEVNDEDLLLLWDGSNAGEFFRAKKGVLSSTMVKFIFDKNKFDSDFLYYQLKNFESFLKAQTNGSGIPHVDREILLNLDVENFNETEQKRIAEILSTADKAIEQTQVLIDKYSRIKRGLMQDLLTRGIDENGNIRAKETHKFTVKNGIEVPDEWDVVKLSEIARSKDYLKTGPFGSSLKISDWVETGVPVVTIGSIGENSIDVKQLLFVSEEKAGFLAPYKLLTGDILFSRVADVGRSIVITEDQSGWIMSSNFMRLRIDNKKLLPNFLQTNLKANESVKAQIRKYANSGGRDVVNSEVLNSLYFPKPDTTEQTIILEKINAIDEKLMETHKLQAIKIGLMQDLLSGKKRVKTDDQTLKTAI